MCLKMCLKGPQLWHEVTPKARIIWFVYEVFLYTHLAFGKCMSLLWWNFLHFLSSVGKCVLLSEHHVGSRPFRTDLFFEFIGTWLGLGLGGFGTKGLGTGLDNNSQNKSSTILLKGSILRLIQLKAWIFAGQNRLNHTLLFHPSVIWPISTLTECDPATFYSDRVWSCQIPLWWKVLPPLHSRVQRSIGPGVSYTPCSFDFEITLTLTLFEGP